MGENGMDRWEIIDKWEKWITGVEMDEWKKIDKWEKMDKWEKVYKWEKMDKWEEKDKWEKDYIQSPSHAYKRFWSIIRKLAVVFLFAKIQNILIRNVWKTKKFAISLSIRTFKILKVTRILG